MKKNVIFWIGVKSTAERMVSRHGTFEYFQYSRNTWEEWCEKNDVVFFPYEKSTHDDIDKHAVTWQRWFDVFDQLQAANIDYDQIALVDGSSMIRLDTPNFFEDSEGHTLSAWRSLENLRWVHEGVTGYKPLFDNFEFDLKKYVSCGFQIFNEDHRPFLDTLKEYYFSNYDEIMKYQHGSVKRGTDQPVYNYMLQMENVKVNTDMMPSLFLNHLQRFDWLGHNWQTGDKTPHFLKHAYIFFFSGFPARTVRTQLMQQTWEFMKGQQT